MLNPAFQFLTIAQLPLAQAGQLLLVIAISFVIITFMRSTYRFYQMVELTDGELKTVDDCNDFFFVQVTRYLSKINRSSTGFGIVIFQFFSDDADQRAVQKSLLDAADVLIRKKTDKACLFGADGVAVILDTEENRVKAQAERILNELKQSAASRPGIRAMRVGVSTFPLNGFTSQGVIDAAVNALKTCNENDSVPICIAPAPEGAEPLDYESGDVTELGKQDKNAAIDPLTGVLNPGAVASYMRKYLADLRMKKEPATLFCVGINRLDQIIELHGEAAADDVIAGVSKVLQRLTRDNDLIGRYHRDDFIILAGCTLQQGEKIAVRLREAVQKETFISGAKRIKATVSIGITAHPEHGRNLRDLFRGAYRALEVVRDWGTTACLVYDAAQHGKKTEHETRRKH